MYLVLLCSSIHCNCGGTQDRASAATATIYEKGESQGGGVFPHDLAVTLKLYCCLQNARAQLIELRPALGSSAQGDDRSALAGAWVPEIVSIKEALAQALQSDFCAADESKR